MARPRSLAETATLDAGLAQQLAVLLLSHALAALLDHRAHTTAFRCNVRGGPVDTTGGGVGDRLRTTAGPAWWAGHTRERSRSGSRVAGVRQQDQRAPVDARYVALAGLAGDVSGG